MTAATQNATHGSSRHFSSFNTLKGGMPGMSKLTFKTLFLRTQNRSRTCLRLSSSVIQGVEDEKGQREKFRQLKIPGVHKIDSDDKRNARRFKTPQEKSPRHIKMKPDQDWTNVWPTAATFKHSVVPFPVRQGAVFNLTHNQGVIPSKYGNEELMKIPNFLHLSPPHIKKHCEALKELCTPWPEGLTVDKYEKYFPVETITSDYCFSSNTIRDPRSRIATVKFKLNQLKLTKHGRDKFIMLVGKRFNRATGEVILTSDRCPLKTQNIDYINYLITVLYHESKVIEPWELELEKSDEDRGKILWSLSSSRKNVEALIESIQKAETAVDQVKDQENNLDSQNSNDTNTDQKHTEQTHLQSNNIEKNKDVKKYKSAVLNLLNAGETEKNILAYKDSVLNLHKIPKFETE